MSAQECVYTIGHSRHEQCRFIKLLQQHGITAVCDVRSRPYSRMNPQFNREALESALTAEGIAYRFLGRELGARSDDRGCYRDGRVHYQRLAETDLFTSGIKRVQSGMKQGFRVALMCAEQEPLECHRAVLVARSLADTGVGVRHILADGSLESHEDAVGRLTKMFHLDHADIFRSREELIAEAYDRQEERIAYEPEPAFALGAAG
jgi:uncharacterized protein (DUF488 family)